MKNVKVVTSWSILINNRLRSRVSKPKYQKDIVIKFDEDKTDVTQDHTAKLRQETKYIVKKVTELKSFHKLIIWHVIKWA